MTDGRFFKRIGLPNAGMKDFRFLFIRQQVKVQNKGLVQIDLFIPQQYGYDFKVVVINKTVSSKKAPEVSQRPRLPRKYFWRIKNTEPNGLLFR